MIKPRKMNGYLVAIKEQLRKAEGKHPKFCDVLTKCQFPEQMELAEKVYKNINSKGPWSAENILNEEIAEALNAYMRGDKYQCLVELAQCGAVILRMMEVVDAEYTHDQVIKEKI